MRPEDRETIRYFIDIAKSKENNLENKWKDEIDNRIKLGLDSLNESKVDEVWSQQSIREKQIEIGKYLSQQSSKIDEISQKEVNVIQKGRVGRPSLGEDKSKKMTVWLKNEESLFLKEIAGDSSGDKIRSIVHELKNFREREKNQIRFLQSLLNEVSLLIDSYVNKFGRSEFYQELNKIIDEVNRKGLNILNLLKIFGIKEECFSKKLSKEENKSFLLMKDLMMKIRYDKTNQ